MKKLLKALVILILIFASYVFYIFNSTGFFRKIENKFDGEIYKSIALTGAEDMAISYSDSFAIISSSYRSPFERPSEINKDGLYYMDLRDDEFVPILLTRQFKNSFVPHGISMIKKDSTFRIIAVNHSINGDLLEVFSLRGPDLIHEKTYSDPSIISPNDVVFIDENRFYFTNDHRYTQGIGKFVEEYAGYAGGNVVYYDGEKFTQVANGITYANGINFDPVRNLVYVASPRKFLIKVYDKKENGSLEFVENIFSGAGVDNLELDEEGNIWTGAHPNLLKYKSYSKGKANISPSEILKIHYREKGNFEIEQIYINDGSEMSASTVAIKFGNYILTGNVMDSKFLILKNSK